VRKGSTLGRIAAIAGAPAAEVEAILERFRAGGRYFVTLDRDGPPEERRVEISHESLIRQWGKLRTWTDEEREDRDRLLEYVRWGRRWKRGNEKASVTLLQDVDLKVASHWRSTFRPTADWAERYVSRDAFDTAMAYITASEKSRLGRIRRRILLFGALVAAVGLLAWQRNLQQARERAEHERVAAAMRAAQKAEQRLSEQGKQMAEKDAALRRTDDIGTHRGRLTKERDELREASKRASASERSSALRPVSEAVKRIEALSQAFQQDAQTAPYLQDVAREAARASADARLEEGRIADLLRQWSMAETSFKAAAAAAAGRPDWSGVLGAAHEGLAAVAEHKLGSKVWNAVLNHSISDHYAAARDAYQAAGDVGGVARTRADVTRLEPWGFIVHLGDGQAWALDNRYDKVIMGRRTPGTGAADIAIDDRQVSRVHALITHQSSGQGSFTIEDMRSTNGTTLNRQQLEYANAQPLVDGDTFTIAGAYTFQFRTKLPAARPKRGKDAGPAAHPPQADTL
jgi:hypothetical protein